MAVNQYQRGLLQVVAGKAMGQTANPDIRTGNVALPDTGAAAAAAHNAQSLGQMSHELEKLGNTVGHYADHAAKVEGEREGRLAGMDPEFRPTNNLTIRGEAFDRAGLEVYEARTRIEIEKDIDAGGDLAAKRAAWERNVPEHMRPDVGHIFDRAALVKARERTRQEATRIAHEATATQQAEIDQLLRGLHQRAYAGGVDAKAAEMNAAGIAEIERTLKRTGVDGKPLTDPIAGGKIVQHARQTVADAQLLGAFSRLPSLEAKEAFIKKLDDDFANSRDIAAVYDFQGFHRIGRQLESELRSARAEQSVMQRGLIEDLKGAEALATKGYALTADQIAGFRARAAASPVPGLAGNVDALEELVGWQAAARKQTPEQIRGYAANLREQMAVRGPNERAAARVEMAEKLAHEAETQLKTDPLGWAGRVQLLKLAPLDPSAPSSLQATFRARIAQADEVAKQFNLPAPVYLRPDERRQIAIAAAKGGQSMMTVSQAITQAAGERAPAVLAELFEHAPVVAMLGGHVDKVGRSGVAEDVADGIALAKTDGFKGIAPGPDKSRAAALAVTQGAMTLLPESEQTAISMTNSAYEVRARRRGVTQFDEDLWKSTFRQVMGERTIGGKTYGGVASSGNGHVVVPPNVRSDGLPGLIEALRPEDFGGEPPTYGDGRAVATADLRRASLVSVGDGRYWLNLGTAESPRYLRGADAADGSATRFTLDINAIPQLRERRPDLYLGGEGAAPRAAVKDGRRNLPAGVMKLGGPGGMSAPGVGAERATFIGVNAQTADEGELERAQQMQAAGKNRTEIWGSTGWYLGKDGKWRSELDDSAVKTTPLAEQAYGVGNSGKATHTLDELLHAADLYDAYPHLADVKVTFLSGSDVPKQHTRNHAWVNTDDPHNIFVNASLKDPQRGLRSILLHEVGHLTQLEEDFVIGKPGSTYDLRPGEAEAQNVETRADMSAEQRRQRPPWTTLHVQESRLQWPPSRLGGPDRAMPEGKPAAQPPAEAEPAHVGMPPELGDALSEMKLDDAKLKQMHDLLFTDYFLAGMDAIEGAKDDAQRRKLIDRLVRELKGRLKE